MDRTVRVAIPHLQARQVPPGRRRRDGGKQPPVPLERKAPTRPAVVSPPRVSYRRRPDRPGARLLRSTPSDRLRACSALEVYASCRSPRRPPSRPIALCKIVRGPALATSRDRRRHRLPRHPSGEPRQPPSPRLTTPPRRTSRPWPRTSSTLCGLCRASWPHRRDGRTWPSTMAVPPANRDHGLAPHPPLPRRSLDGPGPIANTSARARQMRFRIERYLTPIEPTTTSARCRAVSSPGAWR